MLYLYLLGLIVGVLPNYSFIKGYWYLHWTSSIELEAVCELNWVNARGTIIASDARWYRMK